MGDVVGRIRSRKTQSEGGGKRKEKREHKVMRRWRRGEKVERVKL